MPIASVNPATGETLRRIDTLEAAAVEVKLASADHAFSVHRKRSFQERAQLTEAVAALLESEAESLARVITSEMGKLLPAAVEEVQKCARVCRFYASHAAAFLADQPIATDATRSYVRYEPLGAVLAVMPWNFPFWQVFRFAAPALMAGNVALLKHAERAAVRACYRRPLSTRRLR